MAYPDDLRYLIMQDLGTAQQRSSIQASLMGCDLITTLYWWPIQRLMNKTVALRIAPLPPYDDAGLSDKEKGLLVPRAGMVGLLPDVFSFTGFVNAVGPMRWTKIVAKTAKDVPSTQAILAAQSTGIVDLANPAIVNMLNIAKQAGVAPVKLGALADPIQVEKTLDPVWGAVSAGDVIPGLKP